MTDKGPTPRAHNVLLYGAVGSEWAYKRFGDFTCLLARILAWIPALHYVDNFGSIERATTADSAFETFEQINAQLGLIMTNSKSQPPMAEHKMQGVLLRLETQSAQPKAIVKTAESRRDRLLYTPAASALEVRHARVQFGRLIGRHIVFRQGPKSGREVKAIYARQHADFVQGEQFRLTRGLRPSMRAFC
jgi:hypothetical protein